MLRHPMPHSTCAALARRLVAMSLTSSLALIAPPPARAQLSLPGGFVDDLILTGLDEPLGMAFIPDGRVLFVERVTARVRLIVNGALAATDPVLTVPLVNAAGFEQGLLGIAVDPGWPARPYIYVHYDYAGDHTTIRISRFTVGGDLTFGGDGSLTIDPASRHDVLTDSPDLASNHNGGTLRFGPDGMLYVSLGDDANACQGQDLTTLAGKILRLDVSGLPAGPGGPPAKSLITPADNPYVGHPNANARLVAYWGLRNPFRFAIDPSTGSLVIGDVGEVTEEELSHVSALGQNLQWPIYEGSVPGPFTCAMVDSSTFTDPIHTYDHGEGVAVVGGVLYRRPATGAFRFPAEYDGDIFFSDFYSLWVRRLKRSGGTWALTPPPGEPPGTDWATGLNWISDWLEAPDGTLWYCRMLSGSGGSGPGQIRRIRHAPAASVPEQAMVVEFRAPFPSPSRGPVSLDYSLVAPARVALAIHDLAGRVVRLLSPAAVRDAGAHHEAWDGRDHAGREVGAGVYLAALTMDGQRLVRRLTLIR